MSTKEYADKCGVSVRTIHTLVFYGRIPVIRRGRYILIRADTPYPCKRRTQYGRIQYLRLKNRLAVTNELNKVSKIAMDTGISYQTLYTWIKTKKIPSIKIDGVIYTTNEAVLNHIESTQYYRQFDSFVNYYSQFADIADEHVYDATRDDLSFLYLTKAEHSHKRRACLEQVRKMEVI